ncbi:MULTISPECIES: PspC domain-containing protein [Shewanella]|uniref:PspC domain-containing protein n=1 Tax=Shewanella TaxID=22 RepID=UPI0006D671E2|nr:MULTISPECIES: PspC domain-containing protein [Shewanella]KPZ72173.1 PspC domain protein [Shewanella sp. P1-14-1]
MNMSDVENYLKAKKRLVCGACLSVAKQFGWSVMWTRVLTFIAIFLSPTVGLIGYFIAAIIVSQQQSRY